MKRNWHSNGKPAHRHSAGGKRAFSLTELLVVIVVIGILASLLIPAVMSIRQHAMDSQASNNLRQLAATNLLYATEHGNQFSPTYPDSRKPWQLPLMPYLFGREARNNQEVALLKMDPDNIFNVPDSEPEDERTIGEVSIAVNLFIRDQHWDYNVLSVPRPASIILLAECELANTDTLGAVDTVGNSGHIPGFRREGGTKALVVFCDGHVEARTQEDLKSRGMTTETNLWYWW